MHLIKQNDKSSTLFGIAGAYCNLVHSLKQYCIVVTAHGIFGGAVNDVQNPKVPFIVLRESGNLVKVVRLEQYWNVVGISSTPYGISGIVVKLVQFSNVPYILRK